MENSAYEHKSFPCGFIQKLLQLNMKMSGVIQTTQDICGFFTGNCQKDYENIHRLTIRDTNLQTRRFR